MKTISLLDSSTIRNHQTNISPTKQTHKFSKSQRFRTPNPQCKVAYYQNSSHLGKRQTTFGYGGKLDFTRDLALTPSPQCYQIGSEFQVKKAASKGKSFGLSRELLTDRSYLVPQMQKVPGPGKYQNQVKTKMSYSYTMRPQTADFIQSHKTNRKTPGPGQYKTMDLQSKDGRYKISRYSDTKFCKINPKTPRFPTTTPTPGPQTYREGDSLSHNSRYVLSHHRGTGTRTFDQLSRSTFTDRVQAKQRNVPGPGTYQARTEFGVYGDVKYYQNLRATLDIKRV